MYLLLVILEVPAFLFLISLLGQSCLLLPESNNAFINDVLEKLEVYVGIFLFLHPLVKSIVRIYFLKVRHLLGPNLKKSKHD